jgi:hypothetical protein
MRVKITHYLRLATLLLYSAYAFSPIYASLPAAAAQGGLQGGSQPAYGNVTVGIVWMNFLFDAITDEDQAGSPVAGGQRLQATQDEDMVLIKKKRALSRARQTVRPIFRTVIIAAAELDLPSYFPPAYEIPCDLIHRHSDGYYSRSTGLSPPVVLS